LHSFGKNVLAANETRRVKTMQAPNARKPAAELLQVKGERRLAVLNAPKPVDARIGAEDARAPAKAADVVVLFVRNHAELDKKLVGTLGSLRGGVLFWLAYPKLTSPIAGDLNRDIIGSLAPTYGLKPVAQIAIDSDWSALRFKPTQERPN
jgi:hypothetical protein